MRECGGGGGVVCRGKERIPSRHGAQFQDPKTLRSDLSQKVNQLSYPGTPNSYFKVKNCSLILLGCVNYVLVGWRGSLIIMEEVEICKVELADLCLHDPIKRKFPH